MPAPDAAPRCAQSVERIGENCEPALATVLFVAGAGGSLRAGVTENPVRLTRAMKDLLVGVTCGGAPVYVWPGGGITFMVDVLRMPDGAFGCVPTPAIVAPIEFTMRADSMRGSAAMWTMRCRSSTAAGARYGRCGAAMRRGGAGEAPMAGAADRLAARTAAACTCRHGPIDLVIGPRSGSRAAVAEAAGRAAAAFDGLLAEPGRRAAAAARADRPRPPAFRGPVARRMAACRRALPRRLHHADGRGRRRGGGGGAGGADCRRPALERAYVNNGGDIALFTSPPGQR